MQASGLLVLEHPKTNLQEETMPTKLITRSELARKTRPQPVTEPAALIAIRAESDRIGWPVHFATDLGHDANVIATMLPHEPFTWCLRSDGTHMGRAIDTRRAGQLTMRAVAEAFTAGRCHFYVWDGRGLQPMHSAERADERLAELVAERFEVRTRRTSSLVPAKMPDRGQADALAVEWERRYGEAFVTVDTWGGR